MLRKTRILSIDWDYFIDASVKERAAYFPDATTDSRETFLQSLVWANRYVANPNLMELGVIYDYDMVCGFLQKPQKSKAIMVADSHRHAHDFIMKNVKKSSEIELINIDFHHDLYQSYENKGEPHAGDWALKLQEKLPKLKLKWVKRDDSEMPDLPIEEISIKEALQGAFDIIFLCRSGAWSPPHLDGAFIEMAENLLHIGPVMAENGLMEEREYKETMDSLQEVTNQLQEMMKKKPEGE